MNKPSAIWLFAGGQMQVSIAQKIVHAGYQLILTDMNLQCACAQFAHEFVACDTFDVLANVHAADQLKEKFQIGAVLTVAADCHETVAILNRHLGLHGISPDIARSCRQKNITRTILTKAGIRQPRFSCVNNLQDARAFLLELGGKGVIKATDNSASRGFSMLDTVEALTEGAFQSAVSSGTTGYVLIEEALIPRKDCIAELSVETLWFNGKMYWLNWVDRLFRYDLKFFPELLEYKEEKIGWGVEVGHINPAQHPMDVKEKTESMLESAGIALGMDREAGGHILKADIMLTQDGPVIIEMTPRLSGGWDSSATTPARGADFQGGAMQLALGKDLDIDMWHQYFEFKNPSLYASIVAEISPDAKDCIGREFALGAGFERYQSLQHAMKNLKERKHVI
jgi:biotin carboxylase